MITLNKKPYRKFPKPRLSILKKTGIVAMAIFGGFIPVRLAIAHYQAPTPQGILTLGGARSREYLTARVSRSHPELDVWISSGSLPKDSAKIFRQMGAKTDSVNLDYSATDTISNFTTILPQLQEAKIKHVYIITSDYHMDRAKAIATIVLGSNGIAFTPLEVPSNRPNETFSHIFRDVSRSVFWLATGKTGSRLKLSSCYGMNELQAMAELFKKEENYCQAVKQPQ